MAQLIPLRNARQIDAEVKTFSITLRKAIEMAPPALRGT